MPLLFTEISRIGWIEDKTKRKALAKTRNRQQASERYASRRGAQLVSTDGRRITSKIQEQASGKYPMPFFDTDSYKYSKTS